VSSFDALLRESRVSLGEEAVDLVEGATDSVVPGAGEVHVQIDFLLVARALVAERDGDPGEALRRLLALFDPEATLEFSRLGMLSVIWLPDISRLALAVGETAVATVSEREAVRELRPTAMAVARHCRGLVDGDAMAVHDAAEQFDRIGYPLLQSQALENAAVLDAQHDNTRAARSAYLEAVGIYSQLDAAWSVQRADGLLRVHKIRRGTGRARRRPTTGWDALTPMEKKVARMVAAGLSNPDIAGELFLSRHTIESHVSHILTKFNVKSRVEIARAVSQEVNQAAVTS
jgi:DNA-binding CsgD family transcriptional regulator